MHAIPDFLTESVALERYALVGGPDDLKPRIRRVAARCAEDPALAEWGAAMAEALFDRTPGRSIADWPMPEKTLGEDVGAFHLMVALASVPKVAATHRAFGLPPEHLALTFSWFRAMIDLYRKRHDGVPGITHTRTYWFRNHVDGTLFRFGCMEFLRGPAPDFLPADFRAQLGPDDEVVTFHFPGGESLDAARIRDAFAEATAFWKRAFGHYPKAYACDSWLFNPAWQELIPRSRIARLIDLFERLPSLPYNPGEPSGLFFVYDKEVCDPRDYPAETSVEKAFVTLYNRGEKPVDGCAWVRVDDAGRVLFAS